MTRFCASQMAKIAIISIIFLSMFFNNSKAYDRWWDKNFSVGITYGKTSNAAAGYKETNANMGLDAFYAYNSFGPSENRPYVWAGTTTEVKQINVALFKQRLFIGVGQMKNSPRLIVKKSETKEVIPSGQVKYVWEGKFQNEFTFFTIGYNLPLLTNNQLGRFSIGIGYIIGKPEASEMIYTTYTQYLASGGTSTPYRGKLSFTDQYNYFGSLILKYDFPYFPVSVSYNISVGIVGNGEWGHWTWNHNGYIDTDKTNQMGVRSLQAFGLTYYSLMPTISVCFPF